MESLRESGANADLVWLCSDEDAYQREACINAEGAVLVMASPKGSGDYARKINLGFSYSQTEFVLCAADDLLFHPGWDVEALEVADETGAGVIGTNDLANPQTMKGKHSTHSLVRRSYIEERGGTFEETPGVVLSTAYDHQYVDTELVEVARRRGGWAFAADSHIQHLHPIFDKTVPMDETYRRGLANGKQDGQLFRRRKRGRL